MKKLFTLVLALVMVLAIAAPAMAAWNAPDAEAGAPYSIKVTAVQVQKDAYNNEYYTAFPANAAVVAGTPVIVRVEASIPTAAKLKLQYGEQNGATGFDLALKLDNLTINGLTEKYMVGDTANSTKFFGNDFKRNSTLLQAQDKASVLTLIVTCAVKETKAAKFEAILGYSALEAETATFTDLLNIGGDFTVTIPSATSAVVKDKAANELRLTLKDGKVTGWDLFIKGVAPASDATYTVLNGAFVDLSKTGTDAIITSGTPYTTLVAALKVFTDKLGFVYGDVVYFTADNVFGNFGLSGEVSDFCTFVPYTTSLTVSDTAAVPNTGDSVSVIGFVMVGLALLATAAVVVKKVRA